MITIRGINCFPSRGVASLLCVGRNKMLETLRAHGVLSRDNAPCQSYCGKGYFVVERGQHNTITTYYTSAGVELVRDVCKDLPRKKAEDPYIAMELPDGIIECLN